MDFQFSHLYVKMEMKIKNKNTLFDTKLQSSTN